VHDLSLKLDTSGYTGGPGHFLHGVSLKTLNNIDSPVAADVAIVNLPIGSWTLQAGQINANSTLFPPDTNATGSGSGFFSELFSTLLGPAVPDSTYTFDWHVDYAGHNLACPEFKAIYVDGSGAKFNGITSITLAVPEPGTPALLGAGLVGIGALLRKRLFSRGRKEVA